MQFFFLKIIFIIFRQYNASESDRKKFQAGYLLLQSKIKSLNHELYDLQSSNSSCIE